jgi:NDP-sugar pyrophosphorylase family protein
MAGRGKRFSDEGFILPKPLIPVEGKPMIHRVIESLPESEKWIFVVREEHIEKYGIDKVIREKIPEAIITVDKDLLGGVSIFCARDYLEDDEEVVVAGCDFAFTIDNEKYEELKKEADCILWTFTKEKKLSDSPTSWGYAELEEDNKTIKNMSVKVPISENPYNDHAVAATFYIKSVKLLYEGIQKIIDEEIKINNEYYLDSLPVAYNLMKKKSVIFDVDLIVSWGTPREYYEFQEIFHNYKYSPGKIENLSKWEKYFENVFTKR